jgi:hypothetical protein
MMDIAKGVSEVSEALGGSSGIGGVSVTTPGRQMELKVTSAELIENGKSFMIEGTLTNRGEDIETYWLYCSSSYKAMAVDDLGTQASISMTFGNNSAPLGLVNNSLPSNTPMKITIVISGFSSKATALSLVKIIGKSDRNEHPGADGEFVFKNISLRRGQTQSQGQPVQR